MQAELLSVGTELLLGHVLDTNASFLAEKLSGLGIDVFYKTTVGDNPRRLAEALRHSLARSDLVISTGGLGPTSDDITAAIVSEVVGEEVAVHQPSAQRIRHRLQERGLEPGESHLKQAHLPRGSIAVPNPVGTAPGFIVEKGGKTVIALPGVPAEMTAMMVESVIPYLRQRLKAPGIIKSRVLKFTGIGESLLEEKLKDLMTGQKNPSLAPLAKVGEVHLRITAKADSEAEADQMIAELEQRVRSRVGEHIFGADAETIEEVVGRRLRERGMKLATAESCTGGLIGHRLTNVPGSSDYFTGTVVAYSDAAKVCLLGVPEELIRRHGSVSEPVALAMAKGARAIAGSDVGLAVTGIAGPGGATAKKPVGLVHVAVSSAAGERCEAHHLAGDRLLVKERAAQAALNLLLRQLEAEQQEGRG
jgi:nicotinamide-nucleotide amidase